MWIEVSPTNHGPITEFIIELGKQYKIPNICYEKPYIIEKLYYDKICYDLHLIKDRILDLFFNLPLDNWLLEKWINDNNIFRGDFLDKLLKKIASDYHLEDNKKIIECIFKKNDFESICEFLDLKMFNHNKEANNKLSLANLIQTIKKTVRRISSHWPS